MNDLGPLHDSDRLLDLVAARRPLPAADPDPLVLALAVWAAEVDGPTSEGAARPARSPGSPAARSRGRLAAGGMLVVALMTGSSVAAALTAAQVPVVSSVGGALVHLLPESVRPPAGDVLPLGPQPGRGTDPGPGGALAVPDPSEGRGAEPSRTTVPSTQSRAVTPASSPSAGQDTATPAATVVNEVARPGSGPGGSAPTTRSGPPPAGGPPGEAPPQPGPTRAPGPGTHPAVPPHPTHPPAAPPVPTRSPTAPPVPTRPPTAPPVPTRPPAAPPVPTPPTPAPPPPSSPAPPIPTAPPGSTSAPPPVPAPPTAQP
ncbi:hypothetical protein [Ornithinimicrobium flavum]|uniref:hypothetical protein n=1 Tax=Ornithinimicrobium flavum TaxID=1288636 RepID=UPI00130540F2|nr:hypothetical protein [Ornithinimicrobium flavum]